jgi:hypothetical protein
MSDAMQFPNWGPLDTPTVTLDFGTFINGIAYLQLPKSLLTRLHDRGWSYKIDPDRTESFTPNDNFIANLWYGKTIVLAKNQCFPIVGGSSANVISAVSTIYHESTHAYINEFGSQMQPLLAASRLHYKGTNVQDGSEEDIDLVLQESAASYVGDSIEAVLFLLLDCKGVANNVNRVANRPLNADGEGDAIVGIAMKDFQRFLARDVFGTANGQEVTKSIDPRLRQQLDARVLEGVRSRAIGMARAQLDGG